MRKSGNEGGSMYEKEERKRTRRWEEEGKAASASVNLLVFYFVMKRVCVVTGRVQQEKKERKQVHR
jgi:hypothetical protein